MTLLEIFLLAIALAADAFTVGTTVGVRHCGPHQLFRLSFHFGLFQSLMALAGAMAGNLFVRYMHSLDHWIVCAVLVFIGAHMIRNAWAGDTEKLADIDLTRGFSLIGLSVSVSIDALAAGVGLSAAKAPLWTAVAVIGIVSALATLLAMLLAGHVKALVGKYCEMAAGVVLIGLGVWTVITHIPA
jgi:manganese efflux pump family protein